MAGRYKKKELLGAGSFGKAWLVNKEETSRLHVMKEIFVKGLTEKEKNQALTEVEVLAKCKHLNIVRYKDAFIENGALNIVMEHAENGDLQKKIDSQNGIFFQEKVILDWFVQICFGLKYIHGLNVLHRDLKTQNIFLTQDNIVKIGDFGISKMLQTAEDYANTTIGTPYYLSPEICEKKPYNSKSDMWALGCVLYNLCSLHHPFEAPDFSSLVVKIVQAQYSTLPRHYSTLILDLVKVMLRSDSDQRPTASQLLCVPAMQPYVNAYVKKSLAVRQTRIGSASPMVKHMYERRRSSSPIPVKCVPSNQKQVETPQRRKSTKDYESPEQNKENIDPQNGERSISNRPAWGTPRPSGLKNICPNVCASDPVNRISRTPGSPSPRLSLHREVMQRRRMHSDSPKRGSSKRGSSSSSSPPTVTRIGRDSPSVKKVKLTPSRPTDTKQVSPRTAKAQLPDKVFSDKLTNQQKLPTKQRKIRGKTEEGKEIRASDRRSSLLQKRSSISRITRDESEKREDASSPAGFGDVLGTVYRSLVTTPEDLKKCLHRAEYHLELCLGKDKLQQVSEHLKDSLQQGLDFSGFSKTLNSSQIKYVPLIMHLHQLQQFDKLS